MITPYYEDRDAGITLYCGDARDVLPTLGKVDAVITDPPYGNNYSTGHRQAVVRSSTRIANDHLLRPLLNDTVDLLRPLLNDDGVLYWFAAPDRLDDVLPAIRRHLEVVNVLCWDKGNCTAGDLDASYGKQWEAIVFARASRSPMLGGRDRDIVRVSRGDVNAYQHPTQKPSELMAYLIRRHAAKMILDPFAGSGTTLVAAKLAGRRAIGIELEEKYCDIAVNRLRQSVLFGSAGVA